MRHNRMAPDREMSGNPRQGIAGPGGSDFDEGKMQTSRNPCRENARLIFGCHPRLVRKCARGAGIQYSRDGNDRTEKPRRTGSSAGACHRARIRATRWRRMTAVDAAVSPLSLRATGRREAPPDDGLRDAIHLSPNRDVDCFAALAMSSGEKARIVPSEISMAQRCLVII